AAAHLARLGAGERRQEDGAVHHPPDRGSGLPFGPRRGDERSPRPDPGGHPDRSRPAPGAGDQADAGVPGLPGTDLAAHLQPAEGGQRPVRRGPGMPGQVQAMTPRGQRTTARFSIRIPNERTFYATLGLVGLLIAWQIASNTGLIKKIL